MLRNALRMKEEVPLKFLTQTLLMKLLLVSYVFAVQASAETIAVIGTGNVGGALGPRFSELGHDIIYGSRQPMRVDVQDLVGRAHGNAKAMLPTEEVVNADVVVMATKWL